MSILNSWIGASRLFVLLGVLHFSLIFSLLLLALWFVKKLQLRKFPKTMLLIIICICIAIMVIYAFLAIFSYQQLSQILNLLKYYGLRY